MHYLVVFLLVVCSITYWIPTGVSFVITKSENVMEELESQFFGLTGDRSPELYGPNADEVGPFDEGDIIHPGPFERHVRAVTNENYKKWNYGIIPYLIESFYSFAQKKIIYAAMDEIRAKTCINFVERTTEVDYIRITPGEGCSSYVGRRGGQQVVTLDPWRCLGEVGVVAHELLHVLGFYHEHTRLDRDNYIDVLLNNVEGGREVNFQKRSPGTIDNLGKPYDYNSVMHYSAYAFARDERRPTLMPRQMIVSLEALGQRRELSSLDVEKVNVYYCENSINSYAPPKDEVSIRNYVRPAEQRPAEITVGTTIRTPVPSTPAPQPIALKSLRRSQIRNNPCEAEFSIDAITSSADGTMHMFSGSEFWVADPQRYLSKALSIRDYYRDLPNDIDASFTWINGHSYFFKDHLYWKYIDFEPMSGYPQDIRSGFPGLPDSINAAFIWSENRIIFIKDTSYWVLHPTYFSQVRGPFSLRSDFPTYVQAGLKSASEGASKSDIFIVADGIVYPIDRNSLKVASNKRRQHLKEWLRCDLYNQIDEAQGPDDV